MPLGIIYPEGVFPSGLFAGFPWGELTNQPLISFTLNPNTSSLENLELGQDDIYNIAVYLSDENGIVDLTGATILFCLVNEMKTITHNLQCTPGSWFDGTSVSPTTGVFLIPVTETISSSSGLFFGEFKVTVAGWTRTFPKNHYIPVRIKPTLRTFFSN
jgi:hypothetical protein